MADLFSKGSNPLFGGINTGGWTVNAAGGAYIDDWVTIGINGGIFQGTGTPASPTTALKIWNSGGIGLVEMWKAGVKTFYFDTNGDVTLSGTITATAGSIGGWTIGSGLLSAGSGSDAVGLAPGSYPFYAGNTTAASAPFRVSKAGALTATNATLTGSLSTASGSVLLNANGATVVVPETTWNPVNAFRLGVTETDVLARLEGYWTGGLHSASYARFEVDYGDYATLYLTADASFEGAVVARAESGASYSAQITASSIATPFVINQVGISICDAEVGVFDANGLALTGHMVIDQGAADDYILDLRSSDVDHGITNYATTNCYGAFQKAVADNGGLVVRGFSEISAGLYLDAFVTTENSTKSTAGGGAVSIRGFLKSGAGIAAMSANANILRLMNAGSTVVWIADTDGDTWQNGSITAVAGFGCNSKAAQTAYALDAAISGTADGTYNATEQGLINSLVSQVNKLRAALVANGICS